MERLDRSWSSNEEEGIIDLPMETWITEIIIGIK